MSQSSEQKLISIIYIHWNCYELLVNSIQSVIAFTQMPFEIIVVDNHSNFKKESLRQRFPDLKGQLIIHENDHNVGFSYGTNQGVRLAKGNYLLWLNCDTIFQEDVIGSAFQELMRWKEPVLLGVRHNNPDATYQASAHPFPNFWRNISGLFYRQEYAKEILCDDTIEVDWICGSFVLMAKDIWDQIGELDEQFFTYDEDIDFCLRARKTGMKILYSPCTKIIHYGSATGPYINDKTFLNLRSRFLFFRKYKGKFLGSLFYFAVLIKILMGLIIYFYRPDFKKRSERLFSWVKIIFRIF